jgi:pheromone shutdown protein TraB
MGIGFAKADVEKMSTEELKALSPIVKECWVDEVDELISSHRLGDYWLIERELRKRFLA